MREITFDQYRDLNLFAAANGLADIIDVEAFFDQDRTESLIFDLKECGVFVIASYHNFNTTPAESLLIPRMSRMQEMGGDIVKVAVMPEEFRDALSLISITETMKTHFARCPLVTMSMAGDGLITRLTGEMFGSAITFGAAGAASAPGQIDARDLHTVLEIIHRNIR